MTGTALIGTRRVIGGGGGGSVVDWTKDKETVLSIPT